MTLYTIIESFSPRDGDRWTDYLRWRGLSFERFDSIDSMLRPNLFTEPEDDDWPHIVCENFMLHFITDHAWAVEKRRQIGRGDLVGVRFGEHEENHPGFLGYDLLDGCNDISLLTNWGNDTEIINRSLSPSALVPELKVVQEIQRELLLTAGDDPHVEGCRIVSIYRAAQE